MGPWKRSSLTAQEIQSIYNEWAEFYTHKKKNDVSVKYYDLSLKLKPHDPNALYRRSCAKADNSETAEALNDARAADEMDPLSERINVRVCDAIYQLNDLEDALSNVYNRSHKFTGHKLNSFSHISDVISVNLIESLGQSLTTHVLENGKCFDKAYEQRLREINTDIRPLWKILKEQDHCDTSSIFEKEEEFVNPRERCRRKLAFKHFLQKYMNCSWIDVLFIKALRNHPGLIIPQSQWSSPLIETLTNTRFNATMRYLKMLNTRAPMYVQLLKRCSSRRQRENIKEKDLFRIQYQVHRNMLTILKTSTHLRNVQRLKKLCAYVEEVMGDYVVLRTRRLMPWKFQFINEVYNTLALAYIDDYLDAPRNERDVPVRQRIMYILKIYQEKKLGNAGFVFGDRSSFVDNELENKSLIRHRKFVSRMKKRLLFSDHPIERAYLYHEMGQSQLKNLLFDECNATALKGVEESNKCSSNVWNLLCLLLACKSHASLHRLEKIRDTLQDAMILAKHLRDDRIIKFIELLVNMNEDEATAKKQEELKRTKSAFSWGSPTKLTLSNHST